MRPSALFLFISCLVGAAVDAVAINDQDSTPHIRYSRFPTPDTNNELWKRKGGGRSGGGSTGGSRGGGSSTSSGGSSTSNSGSGSSGGKTGSSGGSSGGRSASTSPTSNAGGASRSGSGPTPRFGGGTVYSGGAAQPYKSGTARPGLATPLLLVGGASLAFWAFAYPHGAYLYPYTNPYRFYNRTSQRNETREAICGCQQYEVCSCEPENNTTIAELVGDGDYQKLNKSVVNVADVNGTQKILIDGTLPNGTTAEDPSLSAAAGRAAYHVGWSAVIGTMFYMVMWL